MTTEAYMKQWLDGWFFTIDFGQGRTRSTVVPCDYIPDHKQMYAADPEDGTTAQYNRKPFSRSEDATILDMRKNQMRWKDIAKAVGRSAGSVQERYIQLCRKLGLDADVGHFRATKPVTPDMKARIVEMRANGYSFGEIAKELELTVNQVADHYYRIAKRVKERAA